MDENGASLRDRAGGLRPEPAAQSQPEALIPSAVGFWESTRPVTHDEAEAAANRFIAAHHKNDSERPRIGIPARPDYDDDLMLLSYIRQQRRLAQGISAQNGPK